MLGTPSISFLEKHMTDAIIILKIIDQCNINCSYCYYYSRSAASLRKTKQRQISEKLSFLAEHLMTSEIISKAERFLLVLHGGEPLMVDPRIVEQFLDLIVGKYPNAYFKLQTNGIDVSDDWLRLISKHKISIGVSVDGPEEIHDKYRKDSRGRGTHSRAVSGT